ncbi:MAG: hypothetical protein R3284_01600, partial [Rubricoccaceae bacterium]|nr:hypothetical protein [Rubricoccaceae bacterium]
QGFSSTDERYSADGAVIPYNVNTEGAFADRSTYVYTEVGLTSRVTLVGQVSYKRLYVTDETFTPTFERRSFAWGTLGLGARVDIGPSFRLAEDALTRVAVNTKVSIPLGYTRNYNPAVGSGQADVEATINIGRSLWPLPGYVQAGVGYRYRTAFFGFSGVTDCTNGTDQNGHACLPVEEADPDFGDEFLVTAEGGAQLGPVLLQLLVDAQWSFRDPASIEESEFVIQPEGFALQRYVRVGAGTTVYLPAELGVSFQVFAAAHAQNALRGAQYFLGVEKKF